MQLRFLIFIVLLILGEYYSFVMIRTSVRNMPAGWRVGVTALYVLATLLTWAGIFMFRKPFFAELPQVLRNIYVAFTIGFVVGKLLVLLVMLADDLRRLIVWLAGMFQPTSEVPVPQGNGITRSMFLTRLALIVGGSTVAAFLYGITNRYRYTIRRKQIHFANLPAAFRGMKIVQISDIHSGSFDNERAVMHGVEMIMKEKPDIIFFTGDLVNNRADEIQPYTHVFSKLSAPLGVYSILGNHDYGDYVQWPSAQAKKANLDRLKATHGAMGWRLLMNEHVLLQRGNDTIALLGIENWGARAGFPKYGDMSRAYAGLQQQNIPFKILLSHDPSHWDTQVVTDYPDIDLTLSGHTHGMQFGIEIPGFKWSPVKYVYKNWAGLYNQGRQHLYVNRGFGFLGYPGRLGILPEITVLELV